MTFIDCTKTAEHPWFRMAIRDMIKEFSFISELQYLFNEIIIYDLSQVICAHEVICHIAAVFLSKVTFRALIAKPFPLEQSGVMCLAQGHSANRAGL